MALTRPFNRGAFVFDITNSGQEQQLYRLLNRRNVVRFPFKRVWQILRQEGCEGGQLLQYVVLEAEYVDRDYAEGYGQLYGRAFKDFERHCYRLHFFSSGMRIEDFRITSFHSEEGRKALERLQKSYLGFSVIRPSCPDTVGRTVILPPQSADRNCFALARGEYSLNLVGIPLTAMGTPFMEQDGMVGACASAAMWVAHMCLYKNTGLMTYSTTEITRLADVSYPSPSRVFPSEGLTVDQVGAGLKRMGHETFVRELSATPFETLKRWLYVHIESKIPVILATEDEGEGHAVVLVGHSLGKRKLRKPSYEFSTGEKIYGSHCWSSDVLVHDDQRGPYLRASLIRTNRQGVTSTLEYTTADNTVAQLRILAAIVPLPPHVNSDGIKAEYKAIHLLHWLRRRNIIKLGRVKRLVVRTFLIPSNEFKEKLDTSRGMKEDLIIRYRLLHLPKYIWVTEWTTLPYWDRPINEKRILGEILVDPTSNPRNLDFLAMHAPGILYCMQPNEREVTPALRRPIEIPMDSPYAPLVRQVS